MESLAPTSEHIQIFSSICEIVAEEEFSNGQTDFYIQNCRIFTDQEENKHQYMKVFEEYIYIVDQAIDAKVS